MLVGRSLAHRPRRFLASPVSHQVPIGLLVASFSVHHLVLVGHRAPIEVLSGCLPPRHNLHHHAVECNHQAALASFQVTHPRHWMLPRPREATARQPLALANKSDQPAATPSLLAVPEKLQEEHAQAAHDRLLLPRVHLPEQRRQRNRRALSRPRRQLLGAPYHSLQGEGMLLVLHHHALQLLVMVCQKEATPRLLF